jgi:hypothetical protein
VRKSPKPIGYYGECVAQVLIRDGGAPWRPAKPFPYLLENELQDLLFTHPSLIPGVSAAARTVREMQSGVGPADVIAVDEDGALTVVECKLATNQEGRREIVGQVFDYAAQLSKMPIEEFEARWNKRTDDRLFGADDAPARAALPANLAEGRFRMVLAVDQVNSTLRSIVEFISSALRPETSLVVVEYQRWQDGSQQFLVPQMYGQDLQPIETVPLLPRTTKTWTLEEYLSWVRINDPSALPAVAAIVSTQEALGSTYKGGNGKTPSGAFIMIASNGLAAKPFTFFVYPGTGTRLEINFEPSWTRQWQEDPVGALRLESLLDELEDLPELAAAVRSVRESGLMNRPGVLLRVITGSSTDRITRALTIFNQGLVAGA